VVAGQVGELRKVLSEKPFVPRCRGERGSQKKMSRLVAAARSFQDRVLNPIEDNKRSDLPAFPRSCLLLARDLVPNVAAELVPKLTAENTLPVPDASHRTWAEARRVSSTCMNLLCCGALRRRVRAFESRRGHLA
jgi:hypothetical protein